MTMKIKDIGEIGLIERISRGIRLDKSVIKGIGDDTAVLEWSDSEYLLYTCDMLVEDVHFKSSVAKPFQIGWKAMARNLSDIAAMGGIGRYALVSIAVDPDKSVSYIEGIYKGVKSACTKFKVNLVGGDMSKSKKTVIDVSLIGTVEKRNLVTRGGARKGDIIFVTGSIGGSIKRKHLNFTPRIDEARTLVSRYKINSMIDVTDGLLLDLSRILRASEVGATICKGAIPVASDAVSFGRAVTDGEDFELLFTMSPSEARRMIESPRAKLKIPVSAIGEITEEHCGFRLVTDKGEERIRNPKGYLHF